MADYDYDLLVIGSGPAGQRAAIQAAKLNKRVAVVERKAILGGVCINTGTIPSKTLREAVLHLSGYREHSLYGASYTVKQNITMADLLYRTDHVIQHELDIVRHQLQRNRVELVSAEASFVDGNTVRLKYVDGVTSVRHMLSLPQGRALRKATISPLMGNGSLSATTCSSSIICRAR